MIYHFKQDISDSQSEGYSQLHLKIQTVLGKQVYIVMERRKIEGGKGGDWGVEKVGEYIHSVLLSYKLLCDT